MNKKIQYYRKSVYGNVLYYIAANLGADMFNISRQIKKLTGRETLTIADMNALQSLGFEFVEILESNSWLEKSNIEKLKDY